MPELTCPSRDDLSAFVLGRLPETKLGEVGRHLDRCPDCESAVEALERLGDELIAGLRAGAADSSGSQAAAVQSLPSQLGDYRIVREIGRGGMGIVYEAVQVSLGRRVAVKVLPRHFLLGPDAADRFRREARAAARLHHTNIVQVYGTGEQDDVHYFVMQFIAGEGLDNLIVRLRTEREATESVAAGHAEAPVGSAAGVSTGLPSGGAAAATPGRGSGRLEWGARPRRAYWLTVARVGLQVAEALAFAHGLGVLHRDVKPSNLLLDGEGRAWLADFGLAKESTEAENLTASGHVIGTLRYVPPERLQGDSDARGDVYGLGITLYELLTLRPAFRAPDRSKLLHEILNAEPPRPRRLDAAVPRDLETIVLKAMDRDPAHRYQTAAALADDLRFFLEDRPIRARRVGGAERLWR